MPLHIYGVSAPESAFWRIAGGTAEGCPFVPIVGMEGLFFCAEGDAMRIISNLTATPQACVLITVSLFLVSLIITCSLLNALLKMHRSKSAVKKIMKEYRFLQKVWMYPYEAHCLHAISFCRFLIYLQRISYCSFTLYLMTGFFCTFRTSCSYIPCMVQHRHVVLL